MTGNNNIKINISVIDNAKCPSGYNPVICPAVQYLKQHRQYIVLGGFDVDCANFKLNEDTGNKNSFDELISIFIGARETCIKCQEKNFQK